MTAAHDKLTATKETHQPAVSDLENQLILSQDKGKIKATMLADAGCVASQTHQIAVDDLTGRFIVSQDRLKEAEKALEAKKAHSQSTVSILEEENTSLNQQL